jgi:hypothetical protein
MRMETVVTKPANRPPPPPPSHKTRAPSKFEDFVPDLAMTEVHRAAQFLDWAAQHMPKRFVPFVWIAKNAYAKPRVPRGDSVEVTMIRQKRMDQIKRVLWETYKRRTVPAPRGSEPGVRATYDHDDLAGTDLVRSNRRVINATRRVAETHAVIDPDQMRDERLKELVQSMAPVIKKLTQPDLIRRLELPPGRKKNPEDKE